MRVKRLIAISSKYHLDSDGHVLRNLIIFFSYRWVRGNEVLLKRDVMEDWIVCQEKCKAEKPAFAFLADLRMP
jgi:hypothetical protein